MLRTLEFVRKAAATRANVLITGETGTGKELLARLVHERSRRASGPFVSLNCAAIPDSLLESELFGYDEGAFTGAARAFEGKFRLAGDGTVLLDEVGDMSLTAQSKVLRAIDSGEIVPLGGRRAYSFNARIISATNRDLEQMTHDGLFRSDLYFRLNVVRIHVPPLRNRPEDIPCLLQYYFAKTNQDFRTSVEGFTDEVNELLLRYNWPGNVREVKNLVEAVCASHDEGTITLGMLPPDIQARIHGTVPTPGSERQRLINALSESGWNRSEAAKRLRWSRMTLYRKMAKYEINSPVATAASA
jgi:two-component system response regulator HydG/two-component system response regulator AtoC